MRTHWLSEGDRIPGNEAREDLSGSNVQHSALCVHRSSFIVFAPNPWHGLWRNRQQLFSRLAGSHQVLYVEPARTSLRNWREGRVSLTDLRRSTVVEEQPNLWLYRIPAWLPTRGSAGTFDRLSDRVLLRHLRRTLRALEILPSGTSHPAPRTPHPALITPHSSPRTHHSAPLLILWLYRPTNWRWAAQLPHDVLVYHITDDYTAFGHLSEAQRQILATSERELLAAADLTIVTSSLLLDLKQPFARRIALVPNAVDYQAFQQALADPKPPAPIRHLSRPILGYSGHISSRLDLPLLRELAQARPDWQVVYAGSIDEAGCAGELAALKAQPNVHFLGLLPVTDVPHYIAACDVCLIPYRVNDETRAISSLKLYEYLAAGKPVVSTAVPASQEHAGDVRIAEASARSWEREIVAALEEADDPSRIAARQAVAAANRWEDRVAGIEFLLAQMLDEEPTQASSPVEG